MAEQLTLEALGVDRAELARRMTTRQGELGRSDEHCAELAGVKPERWAAWCNGSELPGLARLPKIAAALDTTPPALMFGIGAEVVETTDELQAGRRDARFALELADLTAAIVTLSGQVSEADSLLINGGTCGRLLIEAGEHFVKRRASTPGAPDWAKM